MQNSQPCPVMPTSTQGQQCCNLQNVPFSIRDDCKSAHVPMMAAPTFMTITTQKPASVTLFSFRVVASLRTCKMQSDR